MSQPNPPFGDWLSTRISEAGYRSPSAFANAAGIQPSVVLRWIKSEVQPTPDGLLKAAETLGVKVAEMLARGLGIPDLSASTLLHPVAARVQRIMEDDSPVPLGEREFLEMVLNRIMTPVEERWFRTAPPDGEPLHD